LANPTFLAAAAASVGTVIGAILAYRVKAVVARNDITSRSSQAQLEGWDRYTGHLMTRVGDLEEEVRRKDDDCDRRIANVETEMRRRDDECRARISSLELRLSGRGI
jgi:hypothetical protein